MSHSNVSHQRLYSSLSVLVLLIVLGALVASLGGLFMSSPAKEVEGSFLSIYGESVSLDGFGLYARDSISCAAQARGQDIVTLFVGIPFLITGTLLMRKSSLRGKMLQCGALGYMLYTYASFSFLSMYNRFFLLYVALFGLSLFAFIISFRGFGPDEVAKALRASFPRSFLGGYLVAMGALLALLWIGRIVPSMIAGIPPAGIEHYTTLVIQALDLGVVVPSAILTGVLLIKKHPLGGTLAAVLFIKLLTMALALFAMMIMMHLNGVELALAEVVIFCGMLGVGIFASCMMFFSVSASSGA